MQSPDDCTGPMNLGNPGEYSILEVAEMVLKLTGARSKIVFKPLPQDDPTQRQPDITLAKRVLGWEPKVTLEEGLQRTVAYFTTLLHGVQ
jgi:UDP-glucuronate decarboxylase